jgi:LacI family transcriptional regulator
LPTSVDVAALAGVSRATVSNVINKTKYVSPELRQRVNSAIRALNYRPHGIARSLAARKTFSIAVLVPRIASTFYPPIISSAEKVLATRGYSIILCDSDENTLTEEKNIRLIGEKRVDGLIWVPCDVRNTAVVQSLRASGMSVVVLDRRLTTNDFSTVTSDNLSAGKLAAEYLIEKGFKRIAILTFAQEHAPARERLEGFRAACIGAGIELPERFICIATQPELPSACEKLSLILRSVERPEALFACSDLLTLAAVKEARAAHLEIPGDIAILGFDDSQWGPYISPPLSVITQDRQGLGTLAAHLLLKEIEKKRPLPPELIELPVTIVERGSCQSRTA